MSLQFVVLLAIMALWALTSLLSREAQPLPPRPTRGPGLGGPRPGMPLNTSGTMSPARTGTLSDRRPATALERTAGARWNEPAPTTRPAPPRGLSADDGLVILESDTRAVRSPGGAAAPTSGLGKGKTGSSRRGSRGRSGAGAGGTKPTEPGRPRALTTLVTQAMAQKRNRPLEIAPLASPLAPINSPLTEMTSGARIEHPGSLDAPPAFTGESLRSMLGNPTKLREAAMLTELLQPPLALRRSRRLR